MDKHLPWHHLDDENPAQDTGWARDLHWLHEVAQTPERDLRGHRIALTYHALAIDLYKWIYDVDSDAFDQDCLLYQRPIVNANWFNFATWATVTLNADIRNDDAPYRSDRMVPFGFRRRLTPMVLAIKSANHQRYNQLLTWYQRLVFINTTFAYAALRASEANVGSPKKGACFATIDAGRITCADHQWIEDAKRCAKTANGEVTLE